MKDRYYRLLEQIRSFFKRIHHSKAVVGVSGGVDSALCLRLCVDSLGAKNVAALIMPEKGLTSQKNV